jgi:metallo-beta-lactamase class B
MKTTILARLTCSLTFLSLAATLAAQSPSPAPEPSETPSALVKSWLAPAEPLHIVGPINFVGTQGLGVYLITTPAGHILLGGGLPKSAATIEASVRKLGHKPEDIKILLSNHAHCDHVGTLADFKKLTGAAVAAMDRDVDLLASGGKIDYLFAKTPRLNFPPVTADRVLKDGDVVELGGVKLTARRTAGHTPGCTTFTTPIQDGGRSYSVAFPDGTSVNEGTRFVNNPSYPGILEDYRRTFSTLESLQPDIFLTYHVDEFSFSTKRARAATEGVQAFVDPDSYKSFVAERKAKFEKLVVDEESSTAHESLPTPAR